MEKVDVNIQPLGNILELRTGAALPLKEPLALIYPGNIKSVKAYLDKHKDAGVQDKNFIDPHNAVIAVNKEDMTIKLLVDPQSVYGTVITGKIDESEELKAWGISIGGSNVTMYNREQLVKMLRFGKIYFPNKQNYQALLDAYMKFAANVNTKMSASDDTRGNKAANMEKKVDLTGLPESFVLELPIYKGENKIQFTVDICCEATDANVKFWFESVELRELLEKERDRILEDELKGLDDTYVVMYS